jgi:hypothetical protein
MRDIRWFEVVSPDVLEQSPANKAHGKDTLQSSVVAQT